MAVERRHPVAPNDAVWLQDTSTNLMVINGVYTTDHIDLATARDLFLRKVIEADGGHRYPRFRWKVVKLRGRYYWEPDARFDVTRHIVPAPDQAIDTTAKLQDYIGALADHPLPPDRPLWQFQYVEHFEDGGSAFIVRMHHCMADGIAMLPIIFALMDGRERLEQAGKLPPAVVPAPPEPRYVGVPPPNRLGTIVKASLMGPVILAQRLAWRADRHVLHGPSLSGRKRVAWTRELDLGAVKAIKNHLGATVNDVLMATVSGGFARYFLRAAGSVVPQVRVSMPVNVRGQGEPLRMENRFAAVLLELPIGSHTARERVAAVKAKMDALKRSVEPIVIYSIVQVLLTTLPHAVSRMLIDFLANKCTMVVTNVPGPQEQLTFGGRRLRNLMFWVPQRAHIGVGVSILTFAGTVRIGVIADRDLVPDPAHVIEALEEEFEALRRDYRA